MRGAGLLLVAGIATAAVGCGGGDSGAGHELNPAYVRKANAICARGHRRALAVASRGGNVVETVMPVLERTIIEVAHDGISSGDKKAMTAFVLAYLDEIHTNLTPREITTLGQLEAKFVKSAAMARELGIANCAVARRSRTSA